MNHFTRRTIRSNGQWVQITRDAKERQFVFASGYEDELRADDIKTYSFKYVSNWNEAIETANRIINR
jgi:hypothetical protein